MRRLHILRFVALAALAILTVFAILNAAILLFNAGDVAKVPQTRIESDVPVLIDGVPHRCDFTVVAETSGPDTARATCEENTP